MGRDSSEFICSCLGITIYICGSLRLSPLSPPLPPLLPCESSFDPPLLLLLPAIHVARPLPGPMHVAPPGPSAPVGPLPRLPVMRPLRANSSGGYVGRDARGKESKERKKGGEWHYYVMCNDMDNDALNARGCQTRVLGQVTRGSKPERSLIMIPRRAIHAHRHA